MPLQLWFGLPKSHLYLSGIRYMQSVVFVFQGPHLLFYLGLWWGAKWNLLHC